VLPARTLIKLVLRFLRRTYPKVDAPTFKEKDASWQFRQLLRAAEKQKNMRNVKKCNIQVPKGRT
jgi:hypothetical protein